MGTSLENSANAAAAQSTANAAGATDPSGGGLLGPGATPPAAAPVDIDPAGGYGLLGPDAVGGTEGGYEMGGPAVYGSPEYGSPAYGGAQRGGNGVAGLLAEFFGRPLLGSAAQYQPTLSEQAALSLHQGNQRGALALYHAHLIAERDAASSSISEVGFSPLLRRPVWAVRLGVSINAKVPPNLADDPQPIREGDKPAAGRSRGGPQYASGNQYASGSGYGTPESSPESPEEMNASPGLEVSLEAYAGDPGGAGPPGMYGQEAAGARGPGASGADGAALPALPTTPGGDQTIAAQEELDRHLGLVAEILQAELTQRISAGTFGTAWRELPSQATALAEKLVGAGRSVNVLGNGPVPMWIPGVDYLGTGHPTQVLEKAKENEIDVLLHFEVGVKENRAADPQYVVRCRVINVATGETLGASKMMDKRDVLLAARRSDVKKVVKEMLGPALEALDSKAAVVQMPQLAPQHAVSRIDALLASPGGVRMKHLAEISMFHARGLIDDDQLDQAVFFAIAEDGLLLLYGEQDQRSELASRLVAGELGEE